MINCIATVFSLHSNYLEQFDSLIINEITKAMLMLTRLSLIVIMKEVTLE